MPPDMSTIDHVATVTSFRRACDMPKDSMYAFEFEGLVVYAPGTKTPVAGATWQHLIVLRFALRSRCLVNLAPVGP